MDISLPNNLENILKAKVADGIFNSMDEAITFAIQFAFIDNEFSREKIVSLNTEIEKGWQEMEAALGRSSKEVFEDLKKRYV